MPVQSLLIQIQDRLGSGESLSDILYLNPDAVRENWQNLGGNSLLFKLLRDGKVALLKAKGNDQTSKTIRYDNLTMKVLPFGANVEINGENYFAFYFANFDPLDPQNPDPNDLANWKFFLSIPSYAGNPVDIQAPTVNWSTSFQQQGPIFPLVFLYADPTFQQNHPLLAQLLGIEGNDARNLEGFNPDIQYYINALGNQYGNIIYFTRVRIALFERAGSVKSAKSPMPLYAWWLFHPGIFEWRF